MAWEWLGDGPVKGTGRLSRFLHANCNFSKKYGILISVGLEAIESVDWMA